MKRRIILGENIQVLRKQYGYTQFQLAELIGLHPNYISQIERCEKEPSLKVLGKIKEILHATWIQLLEPDDELTSSPKRRNKKKEAEQKKVVKFLEKLNTKETKLVLNLIRTIATNN